MELACRRHLDDLEKAKGDWKYYFDVAESNRIIDFAEELTLAEGSEEKRVKLYPFQCFILGSLNGWRKKAFKNGQHPRRFRTSYTQLGRQNGKSFLNGILAAFYGGFTSYRYGQIYCTATKQDQADIVFEEIAKFIKSDPDLEEWFKVQDYNHTIICKATMSTIKALSGDTKSLDGHRPYLGIVDEYHAHKTNQIYKLLEGGIKKMSSALISVITTAGFNLNCPCEKLYEHCRNILESSITDDTQFIYIAEITEGLDIWNPENWILANPILEYDRDALNNMIPIAAAARDIGGDDLRDFLVKQLDTWIQWSDNVYIKDKAVWKNCAKAASLEDFSGQRAYIGLDLSQGGDLTSIGIVIPYKADSETEMIKKYFIAQRSFIPAKRVQEHMETDDVPYDLWIKNGFAEATETLGGIKTDYKYILRYLKELIDRYRLEIVMICYDPHNASAFLGDLEAMGFDTLAVKQSAQALNDATTDFALEMKAGNVTVEGRKSGERLVPKDELLTWSVINAKTVSNSFGETKLEKDDPNSRIDPLYAVIDAWTQAMQSEFQTTAEDLLKSYFEQYDKYFGDKTKHEKPV